MGKKKGKTEKRATFVPLLDTEQKLIAKCSPATARLLRERKVARVKDRNPYTLQLTRNIDLQEIHHLLKQIGSDTPSIAIG